MPALHIKYATALACGLILGGLISVGLYAYLTPSASTASAPAERRVLFWYDPMKPDVKFDQPGPSPFMDMDLVPKYADEGAEQDQAAGIRIDPAQQQNLGLKTVTVRQGRLRDSITLPATIGFNEYQYVIVQARAEGFVEKVYPLTNGDRITRGTPLVDMTIPAWVEAQSEYLLLTQGASQEAQRQGGTGAPASKRDAGGRYPASAHHASHPDPFHPACTDRRGDHRLRSARRNELLQG